MSHMNRVFAVFGVFLVFVLAHGCGSSDYHPDAMSLQREAMKVYKRKPDSALSVLDKAIAIDPSYHLLYNTKAMVYQRKGEYDRAVAELHKSLRWNDTQPEVHQQIGMLYDISARPEKAGDAYNRALALFDLRLAEGDDNPVDERVNRAITLILMGREADGNSALEALAISHPDHPVIQGLFARKNASAADSITREFCLNELVVKP